MTDSNTVITSVKDLAVSPFPPSMLYIWLTIVCGETGLFNAAQETAGCLVVLSQK